MVDIKCFASLQRVALLLELGDHRETWQPANYRSELLCIRRRYQQLKNAPFASDALYFCCHAAAKDIATRNECYNSKLWEYQRAGVWQWNVIEAISTTGRAGACWRLLRRGSDPGDYIHIRRESLQELRELLGNQAYYARQMPPAIPKFWLRNVP